MISRAVMRTAIIAIIAVLGSTILSIVLFYGFLLFSMRRPTTGYFAEYADMSLWHEPNKPYSSLSTRGYGETVSIAPLYVRFTSGDQRFLPDLKPDDLREMGVKVSDLDVFGQKETWFENAEFRLRFAGDRFVGGTFFQGSFAKTRGGKYYSLPISQDEMIEAFGKPLKYTRTVNGAP